MLNYVVERASLKHRGAPQFRQSVHSLITTDHGLRDLSNQSFVFHDLHHELVLCVAFSPDGEEVVASGMSGDVKVYNVRHRSLRLRISDHREPVNVCRFSPDGRVICTGSDDASVRLYGAEKGDFLGSNNLHDFRILDVDFVPNSPKARTHKT